MTGPVCVVIAAWNNAATIASAVGSALAEPEVGEVVVVDDASTDATGDVAQEAAGGDPRVKVLRQSFNTGPAAARNLAFANSTSPYLAVLDADDHVLQGRFAHLLARSDWDLTADNILFVADTDPRPLEAPVIPPETGDAEVLDIASFVQGNIRGKSLGKVELGFLKPVIRREFLATHDLAYDPGLRLGEDYDFYLRALQKGARFLVSRNVGYVARVRTNSLSRQHRTEDLRGLLQACDQHVAAAAASADRNVLAAISAHRRQLRARYLLRAFLDRKAENGLVGASLFAINPPANLPPIAMGVLADKIRAVRSAGPANIVGQCLLPPES